MTVRELYTRLEQQIKRGNGDLLACFYGEGGLRLVEYVTHETRETITPVISSEALDPVIDSFVELS